ncbi:hypothetical protein [Synechococcus sp. MIT S9503]|uniref:hypothetical protein n=1 Tax=Synechococcus sp. MIT S9503 TaxID=3082547 RepID=UPI0039A73F7C
MSIFNRRRNQGSEKELPTDGLLSAITLAEAAEPLAVDVKSREALSDALVKRLQRRSQTL